MQLTGDMLIGDAAVRGKRAAMRAGDPADGSNLDPIFMGGAPADVDHACRLAWTAFDAFRETGLDQRARLLEGIAEQHPSRIPMPRSDFRRKGVQAGSLPNSVWTGNGQTSHAKLRATTIAHHLGRTSWAIRKDKLVASHRTSCAARAGSVRRIYVHSVTARVSRKWAMRRRIGRDAPASRS